MHDFLPFPPIAEEWDQKSQNSPNGSPSSCMVIEPCGWCFSVLFLLSNPESPPEGEDVLNRGGSSVGRETLGETGREGGRERKRERENNHQSMRIALFALKIKHHRGVEQCKKRIKALASFQLSSIFYMFTWTWWSSVFNHLTPICRSCGFYMLLSWNTQASVSGKSLLPPTNFTKHLNKRLR